MNPTNPLLVQGELPHFADIRAEHVLPAVERAITTHRAALNHVRAERGADFARIYMAKEQADAALALVWSPVSHLKSVADTPDLRAAYEAGQQLFSAYGIALGQDAELFAAMDSLSRDLADRTPAERRALELTMRGFHLSGIDLPEAKQASLAAVRRELAQLSTEFSNAVLDATESWTLAITDEARLAGIPDTERATLAANASNRGLEGWLVTLHSPSVQAVLGFADDRDLREEVLRASATRASDQGPDAGRFDNGGRIVRILQLRHEAAELLGFTSPATASLFTKMARDPGEVETFLLDLAQRAKPLALAELSDLRAHAATLGIDQLEAWDIGYVAEKLRRARHAFDQAELRQYLPLPAVMEGLFALLGDLFGIAGEERTDVETWHPDVRFFTVTHRGRPVAGLYLDLYARGGKRGGAWMDVCRPRLRDADREQCPVAYLTCNFAGPTGDGPALLTHGEVVTLFHEMGHCLHHILSEVDLPSIAGIRGVEWDAVELPSQLMENFAWDPHHLIRLSRHVETGKPLPEALVARMLGARTFMSGLGLLRQIELSLIDLRLHLAMAVDETTAARVLAEVRAEVVVIDTLPSARPIHSFSHIFAGGYASGYYSYLWAERLSSDAFELFAEADAVIGAVGQAFRDHILAVGASRPAIESFSAFRGRAPENAALLRARGLAA
jgi:oligopeptidase A